MRGEIKQFDAVLIDKNSFAKKPAGEKALKALARSSLVATSAKAPENKFAPLIHLREASKNPRGITAIFGRNGNAGKRRFFTLPHIPFAPL